MKWIADRLKSLGAFFTGKGVQAEATGEKINTRMDAYAAAKWIILAAFLAGIAVGLKISP
jgi:hypothetical protein